ncbi:hypothetical protein ElyMa_002062000 [Elysia marginata]|uniref:Uncharacterized protein n=1 Tax=Elysia marginata TaxID=1093978 RepID=A0AAV4F9H3_9GAST|nr:hypothetical protein ElyMa_002062000 [Elysia marginata]
MNSTRTYLDFPDYVKKMDSTLKSWMEDDFDLISTTSVFPDLKAADCDIFVLEEFLKSDVFDQDIFKTTLKVIVDMSRAALERQLCDFFGGRIFRLRTIRGDAINKSSNPDHNYQFARIIQRQPPVLLTNHWTTKKIVCSKTRMHKTDKLPAEYNGHPVLYPTTKRKRCNTDDDDDEQAPPSKRQLNEYHDIDAIYQLKREVEDTKAKAASAKRRHFLERKKVKKIIKEKKSLVQKAKYHMLRRKKSGQQTDNTIIWENTEIETRKDEKEFSDEMRFCVMELAGLEVAAGKIGAVIETVGEMCGVKFTKLPSRSACQLMIDEGQVLAQSFTREKVFKRCKGFGIHKDGTSRKKVKILDTSVYNVSTDTREAYIV